MKAPLLSVTAFMAVGVKAAAFAAFARVFFLAFPAMKMDWNMMLWVLAVATMTIGNVCAIAQTNIKRMLAYSSIHHAGYLLVALVSASQLGAVSLLYYLLAYTLMNLGAFGVVILVGRKKDSYLNIYDYSGLGFQHPALAGAHGPVHVRPGGYTAQLTVFPQTDVQGCIVHQIRASTRYVNYKDRKEFCADMKAIYSAPNEESGLAALDRFEDKWGSKYGYAIKSWRNNWPNLATFYKYPEEIRRIMYTTNPIENLNRQIRKVTKNKSSFPTDDSLFKLIYLAIMGTSKKWTTALHNWSAVINPLRIYYKERIDNYL